MPSRELVAALLRAEAANIRSLLSGPRAARLAGGSVVTRGGAICCASTAFPWPLFHRAIGFGILGDASVAALDRIVRHYAALGGRARVEVCEGVTPRAAVRRLERAGFVREEHVPTHVHLLRNARASSPLRLTATTQRLPATTQRLTAMTKRLPSIPEGVTIEIVAPKRFRRFGELVRDGFEPPSPEAGRFFALASEEGLRLAPKGRFIAFIAHADGQDAGTGFLSLVGLIAGLYSGSVLPPFRGRGIQGALIAERVRTGLARGRRLFTSQTAGDNASAHNLRDAGFRLLYTTSFWSRD